MADIAINPVTRRVQFTGNTGTGPFAFTFNVLQQSDIVVYKNNVELTLTTDYTVSLNANGTGSVTLVSALVATDVLVIVGGRELSRTTDFVTAGDLLASSLNEQLDSNVIMSQQLDERVSRTIRSQPGDELQDLYIPLKADRADRLLSFDTEGNVQAQKASDLLTGSVLGANYTKASHTGDGTTVAFSTTEAAGSKNNIQVYIDGVYQNKDTFSISGSVLTFTEAPPLNSAIEFIVGNAVTSLTTDPDVVTYNQGGTGAQDRTLTSRLQDFVSAKDFGAIDDGLTDNTATISTAITSLSNGSVLYIPPKCAYNYESLSSAAKTKIENSDIGLMDHSRSLFGGSAPWFFVSKHLAVTGDIDMFNPNGSGSDLTWIEQDGDATKELCIAVYEYANNHLNIKVGFDRLGEVQVSTGALTTVNRASGNTTDFTTILSSGDSVRIERGTYTVTGTVTASSFSITSSYTGNLDVDVFAHKLGLNSGVLIKGGAIPETEVKNYLTVQGENDQGSNGIPVFYMNTWDSTDGYLDRFKVEVNSSGLARFYTRNTAGSAWVSALLIEPADTPLLNFQNSEISGNINFNSSARRIDFQGPQITSGSGSPEGSVTANVGSTYMRSDGGAGTSFYVKESGSGNTGWVAK